MVEIDPPQTTDHESESISRPQKRGALREWLFALVFFCFAIFLFQRLAQVEAFVQVLKGGRLPWLLVAAVFELMSLVNLPALYCALYDTLDIPLGWKTMWRVFWAAHFVDLVTPTGVVGGTALLFDEAQRRGLEMGRVVLASTLFFLLNFIWFLLILAASFLLLLGWHDLRPFEIWAAIVPATIVLLAVHLLWTAYSRPDLFFVRAEMLFNYRPIVALMGGRRFRKHRLLAFAKDFSQAVQTLGKSEKRWWRPCMHALLVDVLDICVLAACFEAFGGLYGLKSAEMIVVANAVGALFVIVAVTPEGIGVVESAMTALFVSLGVPLERAAVVVLAYRGFSCWLPTVAGLIAFQSLPKGPTGHRTGRAHAGRA